MARLRHTREQSRIFYLRPGGVPWPNRFLPFPSRLASRYYLETGLCDRYPMKLLAPRGPTAFVSRYLAQDNLRQSQGRWKDRSQVYRPERQKSRQAIAVQVRYASFAPCPSSTWAAEPLRDDRLV